MRPRPRRNSQRGISRSERPSSEPNQCRMKEAGVRFMQAVYARRRVRLGGGGGRRTKGNPEIVLVRIVPPVGHGSASVKLASRILAYRLACSEDCRTRNTPDRRATTRDSVLPLPIRLFACCQRHLAWRPALRRGHVAVASAQGPGLAGCSIACALEKACCRH